MPDSLLTLGSFSFADLESPDRIIVRCRQRLAVHRLGSGSISVGSLGEDPQYISFRGIFSGTAARSRLRMLDALRVAGQALPLTWDSRTFVVIIKDLDLRYVSDQWVNYQLVSIVLHSDSPLSGAEIDPLFESSINQTGDITNLLGYSGLIPTAEELASIASLATSGSNPADPRLLSQARAFAAAIPVDPGQGSAGSGQLFEDFVAISGQQAAAVAARNRLQSLIISAASGNQA